MKVLLINGSPRQNGNTSIALAEMARIFEENGIRIRAFIPSPVEELIKYHL